jgi:hypothetical protein
MKNMRALFRQAQPEEMQMERRMLIGTVVAIVIGLIWSTAAMSGWVPITY